MHESKPIRTTFGWIASLLLLWSLNQAEAAVPWNTWHGSEFSMRHWKSEDGLPVNAIRKILQTSDGYIWIATAFGLARYNGIEFVTLTLETWPELESDDCLALVEDKDSNLWIGTSQGLLRYRNRILEKFDTTHGLPSANILALDVTEDGRLWIGTSGGLALLPPGGTTFQDVTESMGLERRDYSWVTVSPSGGLYAGNEDSLYRLAQSQDKFVSALPPGAPPAMKALLPEDSSGRLWIGTDTGVYLYEDSQWKHLNESHGMQASKVSNIYEDTSHTIWIHTRNGGMDLYRNGKFESLPLEVKRQRGQGSMTVYEDREGIFWIGTAGSGLYALHKRLIDVFSMTDGLAYNTTWSVCEAPDGSVWVGTSRGLSRIDQDTVYNHQTYQQELDWEIKTICFDSDGWLWVGKSRYGVHRQKHDIFEPFNEILGLPEQPKVSVIYEDKSGAVWIGHEQGLIRFAGGQVRHFGEQDGMSNPDVRSILQDRHGTLWFGTQGGGLLRWRNEHFTVFDEEDGLSNNLVWTLHEDKDGILWIGTRNGLNRMEDGKIFAFTRKQGLFDSLANQILEDDEENLWISCLQGIYRVNLRDLNDIAAGRRAILQSTVFGEADGMLNSETNGERQPAGCKDKEGRLWFCTQEGVVRLDPQKLHDDGQVPPLVIEQIIADGKAILSDGLDSKADPWVTNYLNKPVNSASIQHGVITTSFRPGTSRVLEIKYTGNRFVDPRKIQFKYRLLGWSEIWQMAGTRRTAVYTDLPPGDYTFQVSAANKQGTWNPDPAEFVFSIAPFFHQTWTFYFLCAVTALSIIGGIQYYRLRVQRRILRMEQFHALEMERSRIAQDMHDDLGASLTKISILSEVAKTDLSNLAAAQMNMDRISTTARRVVDNITEIIWAINPRNDTLDNLCGYMREYAAQLFESTDIQCHLRFPTEIPSLHVTAEFRRNLFLIVKEGLHNILKHAQADEVWIQLELREHWLHLNIRDNGVGFPAPTHSETDPTLPRSKRAGGGAGLVGMRKRVQDMQGQWTINSTPGQGTSLSVSCEIRKNEASWN